MIRLALKGFFDKLLCCPVFSPQTTGDPLDPETEIANESVMQWPIAPPVKFLNFLKLRLKICCFVKLNFNPHLIVSTFLNRHNCTKTTITAVREESEVLQ